MRISLFIFSVIVLVYISGCTSTSFQIHNPAGLESTKWVLDTLNNSKITTSAGKEITLVFDSETKKISGFGGCNSYFGTVKKELDKLSFSGIGSTKMFCDDNMQNETNYFSELHKINKYDTKDNFLYLYNNSNRIMVFHAK